MHGIVRERINCMPNGCLNVFADAHAHKGRAQHRFCYHPALIRVVVARCIAQIIPVDKVTEGGELVPAKIVGDTSNAVVDLEAKQAQLVHQGNHGASHRMHMV